MSNVFSKSEVGVQPNGKVKSNGTQFFNVPNTPEGREFLYQCGKFCNSRIYRVDRKCRKGKTVLPYTPRRRHGEYRKDESEWFAVYINTKRP